MKLRVIGCALLKALVDVVTSEGGTMVMMSLAFISYFVVPYFGVLSILIVLMIDKGYRLLWSWPPIVLSVGSFVSWYYYSWSIDANICSELASMIVLIVAGLLAILIWGLQVFVERVKVRYKQCEIVYNNQERKKGE